MSLNRFDRLARDLAAAGVAPRRVQRIIGELEDHHQCLTDDLVAEGAMQEIAISQARERLGSDEQLLGGLTAAPGLVSFTRRFPAVALGAVPTLIFVMISIAWVVPFALALGAARDRLGMDLEHPVARASVWWIDRVIDLMLPATLAWLFCDTARRRGCSVVWSLTVCTLVGLLAATMFTEIVLPINGTGGLLLVGFDPRSVFGTHQWLPALAPLGVMAADFILRQSDATTPMEVL